MQTVSNLRTAVAAKEPLRAKIQSDYETYVKSGRPVTQLRHGQSALVNQEEIEKMIQQVKVRAGQLKKNGKRTVEKKKNERKEKLAKEFYELAGKRFGMLTAVKQDITSSGQRGWICRCDCGIETIPICTTKLVRGLRTHCGCQRGKNWSPRE